jgi:hypothetical protein
VVSFTPGKPVEVMFVVIDPYWHSPKPVDNVFGGGPKTRGNRRAKRVHLGTQFGPTRVTV